MCMYMYQKYENKLYSITVLMTIYQATINNGELMHSYHHLKTYIGFEVHNSMGIHVYL